MKDFKKGGFGGKKFGGNDRGGRGGFGNKFGGNRGGNRGNDRGGDREMFKTKCSECGNTCEVPFRPTGEKPVFCNDCFGSKRDGSFDRNDRGGRNDRPQKEFTKPAASSDDRSIADLKRSVEALSTKMDSIIRMVQDLKPATAVPAKKESLGSMVEKATKTAEKKPAKKSVAKTAKPAKAPAKKVAKKTTKK